MSNDLEVIADRLKLEGESLPREMGEAELQEIRRTAHRHTSIRNAIEFSFSHMLTALLGLLAGTYYRYARADQQPDSSSRGEK